MTNDEGLRNSIVISTGLHIAMLLFLYLGLPTLFKPLPNISPIVPFEIVEIAEMTNTRVQDKPEETKPPEPESKPQPPVSAPSTPEPPTKAEIKPPEPEATAELAIPKPLSKPEPPKPPKPPAKPQDDLASVLKNVAKLKPQPKTEQKPAEDKANAPSEPKSMAPALSSRLTISEEDALRRQISQCWNMPVGARNAEELIVEVLITVNPDRTVQAAQIVDQSRMSDPYFRAAAEAALRALHNPRCSPLVVPADKYEQWKTIRFNFDPRDML